VGRRVSSRIIRYSKPPPSTPFVSSSKVNTQVSSFMRLWGALFVLLVKVRRRDNERQRWYLLSTPTALPHPPMHLAAAMVRRVVEGRGNCVGGLTLNKKGSLYWPFLLHVYKRVFGTVSKGINGSERR